jgi:D-alanyl-D-alanine carboxypeptidase
MKQIQLLCLIASLILGCNDISHTRKLSSERQRISEILQQKLDSITRTGVVPGMTFAVRFSDGETLSLSSGFSDKEKKIAMNPDDVMFSGSVGKTYVAALVLKLQEKGRLDIKKKAIHYLDDLAWFKRIPNAGDITLEMLLNHTAGVPEYVYDPTIWKTLRDKPDKVWSVEERFASILDKPAVNPPGKGWSYADSHYLILGLIIEKVTGKDYYQVLQELILHPCNLTRTTPADHRDLKGLVTGYTNLTAEMFLPEKVVNEGLYAFNPQLEWTGGGLVSTVSDLCQWASSLYGGQVLSKNSLQQMVQPVPMPTTLVENAGYGLGCFIGEHSGVKYLGHTGFVPGYITVMHYLPARGVALAMQLNSDNLHGKEATAVFNKLKDVILYVGD